MNIKLAIIQFLANEFHLEAENITEDTSFNEDLGLNPTQIAELLKNLQDSLNIVLPEEAVGNITTVGQLFAALEPEEDEDTEL